MTYLLSATKLLTYRRCPQAYYFKHERRMVGPTAFGSTALGTALHQTLAQIYRDWHYQHPLPGQDWIQACWSHHTAGLSHTQVQQGEAILRQYYASFIVPAAGMQRPLGIEGKIQAPLQVNNIEFILTGRYDRLSWIEDGLELIDYKTSKQATPPEAIDLQLGLYYLALAQTYEQRLQRLTLIFLRAGESLSYEVTPEHQQQVQELIAELALRLRMEQEWQPQPGKHCDRCGYQRHCPALCPQPDPLPAAAKPVRQVQLALGL